MARCRFLGGASTKWIDARAEGKCSSGGGSEAEAVCGRAARLVRRRAESSGKSPQDDHRRILGIWDGGARTSAASTGFGPVEPEDAEPFFRRTVGAPGSFGLMVVKFGAWVSGGRFRPFDSKRYGPPAQLSSPLLRALVPGCPDGWRRIGLSRRKTN